MTGGAGSDRYYVDDASDVVIEFASGGTDTVYTTASYTLANQVENLVINGADALNGTGNTGSNRLTGNAMNNVLTGLAGNDRLVGGLGDDDLRGGIGRDILKRLFDSCQTQTALGTEPKTALLIASRRCLPRAWAPPVPEVPSHI